MNHRAQPGAPSGKGVSAGATTPTQQIPKADRVAKILSDFWTRASAQLVLLMDNLPLARPALLSLALPPALCGLALLFARGVAIDWAVALFALLSSVLALASVSVLIAGQSFSHAASAPFESRAQLSSQQRYALGLGAALLALAALAALPVALRGNSAALLVVGAGVLAIALYTPNMVRKRIAPLGDLLAPLSLGPGLVALTVVAQGQRMDAREWLAASAIGCMALAVVVGRHLGAQGDAAQSRRSLLGLIGQRNATLALGAALLASFALAVALGSMKSGLPGALLALSAVPTALLTLSCLALSQYAPARQAAAGLLIRAYSWFGLTLAAGLTGAVIAQRIISAIVRAFGG